MRERRVRPVASGDFAELMRVEEEIFGAGGEPVLGPYYVRLCCEFFTDSCFVAEEDGRIVGYVLCFVRAREAYCTTLAVVPSCQGTRVAFLLLRALVGTLVGRVDSCWFTVKEDNLAARALHAALGAVEGGLREDFYGPGDTRLVSRITREHFERMSERFERIGLLSRKADRSLEGVA
jgi:ribosomal protein S18 acetylase RimI-like enzyme